MTAPPANPGQAAPVASRGRLVLIVCVIAVLFLTGMYFVNSGAVTAPQIHDAVEQAGAWGFAVFLAIFVIGNLMHLPGAMFITAAAFCYGPWVGTAVSVVAGTVGATVNFLVVRRVGKDSIGAIKHVWVKRALDTIDHRPFRTVLILRLVFFTSPTLSALLGLTAVSLVTHTAATFIGMMPMIFVVSHGVDAILF